MWAVGGAQAVALLAYGGTDTDGAELEPVDMVTGPGNVYVTAAKRLLRGLIGIDAEAGTTEIAVLADDTADPVHVAADLISQAEHDPLAASVLVTTSDELADAVDAELERQVAATKHTERIRTALARPAVRLRAGDDRRRRARRRRRLRRRAPGDPDRATPARSPRGCATPGRSSSGRSAPVSLGDYCAGSNHVLPTGGCARHSAGLSVQTFLRGVHVVEYTEDALREVADQVVTLADAEDLPAHGAGRDGAVRRMTAVTVGGRRHARRPAAARRPARPQPLRRAAARRRGPAQHQREPVPAAARAGRRRHRGRSTRRPATLHRYPDRDAVALRTDLAALPDRVRPACR